VLLTRWLTARGGRHARQPRQLPGYGIALHGLMAIGTFVFVLISATVATHA